MIEFYVTNDYWDRGIDEAFHDCKKKKFQFICDNIKCAIRISIWKAKNKFKLIQWAGINTCSLIMQKFNR